MFETFDHTADLGLRVRASSLDELFAEAAKGLFSIIVDDLEAVRPLERAEIAIAGSDREYLLFDWLRELLYRFDAKQRLFSKFEVKVCETGLAGVAWGEAYDARRQSLAHEVKAITYHGLKVEEESDGWLAEFIVDI
jgi:SHS2 domain-containing protein